MEASKRRHEQDDQPEDGGAKPDQPHLGPGELFFLTVFMSHQYAPIGLSCNAWSGWWALSTSLDLRKPANQPHGLICDWYSGVDESNHQ